MRLFVETLRKLARRPATLLTFGVLAAFLLLFVAAVSLGPPAGSDGGNGPDFDPLVLVTFPGAYSVILSFAAGLGGLFAVIFGAAIAGSEWSWGTLKSVVARGESRTIYVVATFAAVAVVVLVGLLATYVIGIAGAALGATVAGVPLDGIGDTDALARLPEQFARSGVAIVSQCAIGFTVATLARSQLAGIGFGIAVYFVGQFATIFLPKIVQYLPFQLAGTAMGGGGGFGGGGGGGGGGFTSDLSPDTALLLLGVWLVGSLAVAAGFSERAEVLG